MRYSYVLLNTYDNPLKKIIDHSVSRMVFDQVITDIGKGLTQEQFFNNLRQFMVDTSIGYGYGFELLKFEIASPKALTSFFMTLSDSFMNSKNTKIGQSMGNILDEFIRHNTFFGWIHESQYMFGKYPDRVIDILQAVNYDFETLYHFIEQNPEFSSRIHAENYNQDVILNQLRDIMIKINNDIDTTNYLSLPNNGMEFDMVTLLFAGAEFSTELKTVKEITNTGSIDSLRKKIAVDTARIALSSSKTHFSKNEYKNQGEVLGVKRYADIGSPIFGLDDGKTQAIATFKELLSVRSTTSSLNPSKVSDLRYPNGLPKGDLAQTLYSNVAKKINKFLSESEQEWGMTLTSVDDIKNVIYILFDPTNIGLGVDTDSIQSKFLKEIKDIVFDVYQRGRKETAKYNEIMGDSSKEYSFYNNLGSLFYDNADNIIVKLPGTSDYKLIWKDNIEFHFLAKEGDSTVKVTEAMLHALVSNDFFLIDEQGSSILKDAITSDHINIFEPLVFIYDESTGANGITKSSIFQNLPTGYGIGYCVKDSAGNVVDIIPNMFFTNEKVELFESRVSLKNNEFIILSEGEYQKLVESHVVEQNGYFILKDTYWSIGYITGDNVELFIQEFEPACIPTTPFTKYIDEGLKPNTMRKNLLSKSSLVTTTLNKDSFEALREELSGIFTVLRQIEELYDEAYDIPRPTYLFPTNLEDFGSFWFTTHGKEIINNFFRSHGFSETRPYTKSYLSDVIKVMDPSPQDLEIIQMEKVSQSSVKKFYQTFYKLITQKISHSYFSEFQSDLQGTFSSGSAITTGDYKLIKIMDQKVLPTLLGYPAFAALSTGFLDIDADFKISFTGNSKKFLGVVFNIFGIKPLFSKDDGKPLSHTHFTGGHTSGFYIETFGSIFTSGFHRLIKVGDKYRMHIITPPKATLSILYSDYQFSPQSPRYYTARKREIVHYYSEMVEKLSSGDSALDHILNMMIPIEKISIHDFLVKFDTLLPYLSFEVNEHTLQNYIDYYSLNFHLEGDYIVNDDYIINLEQDATKIAELLSDIKDKFEVIYSIEDSDLAYYYELDTQVLVRIMLQYGELAGINFYYADGVFYNKDKN